MYSMTEKGAWSQPITMTMAQYLTTAAATWQHGPTESCWHGMALEESNRDKGSSSSSTGHFRAFGGVSEEAEARIVLWLLPTWLDPVTSGSIL